MVEIERKFLVISDVYKELYKNKTTIVQAFLNHDKKRTVRIRIRDDKGYLTIKGESSKDGTSRYEWEKEIRLNEAKELLNLCEKGVINKTRYEVEYKHHTFEIDEFHDANQGLVIAEIELNKKDESFSKPDWLGKEVTGEIRYYNSQLSKKPYTAWKD